MVLEVKANGRHRSIVEINGPFPVIGSDQIHQHHSTFGHIVSFYSQVHLWNDQASMFSGTTPGFNTFSLLIFKIRFLEWTEFIVFEKLELRFSRSLLLSSNLRYSFKEMASNLSVT